MDNFRPIFPENTMQSGVHAVIESRPFAQVSNLYPSLIQQTVEVASQPPRERNDCCFIPLTVQSFHDMNRDALGATGAEHWNDMDHFDLFHHLSSPIGGGVSFSKGASAPRRLRSRTQDDKAILTMP